MRAISALALFICAQGQTPDRPQDGRKPVPDAVSVKEVERQIRELFKSDYAKRTPADKSALARNLLKQAQGMKDDPKSPFVLYQEAKDLAIQAGDIDVALEAAGKLTQAFQLDPVATKMNSLTALEKSAPPSEHPKILQTYLTLADEACRIDDHSGADKAATAAVALAKRLQNAAGVTQAEAKKKAVADQHADWQKLKSFRATLATNPEDPAANGALGKHECFVKQNWDKGLPMLVKGGDAALKAAAQKDLTQSNVPAEQAAIGDAWWDLAEKERGATRDLLKARATLWYEKAAAGNLEGFTKTKVLNRLIESWEQRIPGVWVEMDDPKSFGQSGGRGDPIELKRPPGSSRWQIVTARKLPPGSFNGISLRFKQTEVVGVWLFFGDHSINFQPEANISINEMPGEQTGKALNATHLTVGTEFLLTLLMVAGDCIVYVNGKERLRARVGYTAVTRLEFWTHYGAAKVDRLRLRKIQ